MSKYRLTQRNVDCAPDFQIKIVDFNTVEELELIDFVNQWLIKPEFIRLSLLQNALLVELEKSNVGIAFIKNLEGPPADLSELSLPVWNPPLPKH